MRFNEQISKKGNAEILGWVLYDYNYCANAFVWYKSIPRFLSIQCRICFSNRSSPILSPTFKVLN